MKFSGLTFLYENFWLLILSILIISIFLYFFSTNNHDELNTTEGKIVNNLKDYDLKSSRVGIIAILIIFFIIYSV
jgi:uncharacterized membrane protein YhaH (DUF805 family)